MNYRVSLFCEIEAQSMAEAETKAMKYLKVSEAKTLAISPFAICEALKDFRGAVKEHFIVFNLNTQNEIISRDVVSIGTLNSSIVHPREVFKKAIELSAASIVVAHNHPSGSLEPSTEDLNVTRRLQDAGKLLGIELLDHVIVTEAGYTSLKEKNLI